MTYLNVHPIGHSGPVTNVTNEPWYRVIKTQFGFPGQTREGVSIPIVIMAAEGCACVVSNGLVQAESVLGV